MRYVIAILKLHFIVVRRALGRLVDEPERDAARRASRGMLSRHAASAATRLSSSLSSFHRRYQDADTGLRFFYTDPRASEITITLIRDDIRLRSTTVTDQRLIT